MSAISTALMPLAAYFDLKVLLFLRLVQGLAYAANFGAIGTLCVRWAPLAEVSIFISVLTSFTPVSAVVTNPLSGWLCNTGAGWPSAFYSHAGFCFVVFILWIVCYTDDPQSHPSVTEKELAKIQKDKTRAHIERDSFVPYKQLLSNKVIWIVWFNAFVEMVTVTLVLTYAPLYFHLILGYDIGLTGTLVSLSSVIHLPIKFVGGIISDRLTSVSERNRMWFFNTMSVGLAGVCTALIGIFPKTWPMTGVLMFTAVVTLMGLNTGGFYKCGTLTARQYAHVVLTVIQFMKCVALFVAPATVAMFVYEEDQYDQWRYVFWLHGIFLIIVSFPT
ncbi:transporter, major facilitator family protein [Oesophagostomum dentatum]|uniref:Transporter, major facilitator family protein n=1 Tax=Oesophagostomum dentatum TaxID=61180 RepID=A0A0B1S4V8_OESDE|nr:transporter, major facilitator family protein [Oesophagostomum dentatum]